MVHWPYIGFAEKPLAMNSDLDLLNLMNPFEVWIFLDYLIFFKIEIQISEGVIAEADLNNHSDIDHTQLAQR